MKIVVQDANVLIDLQIGDLLGPCLRLGWEAHTTDSVLDEVDEPLDQQIREGHLKVDHLTGDELANIALQRLAQPRRISIEDCTLLELARRLGAVLLTGDANLRYCAGAAKIEVRGTLWILDSLVEAKALSARRATAVLQKLLSAGRRLPQAECEVRFKRWA